MAEQENPGTVGTIATDATAPETTAGAEVQASAPKTEEPKTEEPKTDPVPAVSSVPDVPLVPLADAATAAVAADVAPVPPPFPHAIGRPIAELADGELVDAITAFIADKDISQLPCFMASHQLFPHERLHGRFERAFFAAVRKMTADKEAAEERALEH